MALPGEYLAVYDGTRWVSVRGDKGDPGTSLTVKGTKPTVADLPNTATVGEAWIVAGAMHQWDGTAWNNLGNVQGPPGAPGVPGPKGDPGVKGDRGTDGTSATVRIGSVTSGPTPAVTNTGTNSAAVLNFTLAKGDTGGAGPKGDPGATPSISVAATTTLPAGSPATVSATSTGALTFGIPKGDAGPAGTAGAAGTAGTNGKDGTAATITLGTVTTLAAGQPATAKNTGTASAAVIEFSIPQGAQGIQGVAGPAGATGAAGKDGSPGATGATGATGAAGKDGSGVTITGTQNGGTWPPTGTHTKGDMILIGTPVPTGVPAGTVTGQGMVYTGTVWTNVGSIQGPAGVAGATGPAGPSKVSTDAGNYSKLGTDSLIYTPTPTIPTAATANPLTDGAAAPGVSTHYAREDHVHPLPTLTALGAAATKHTHAASTDVTGLATVATTGKYADLVDGFTLPTASATVLGAVKVGTGLTITAGVLAATATTVDAATTTKAGTVTLADAAAITAGTSGRIPDAAQLKGQVDPKAPKANPAFTGVVSIPSGTAAAPGVAFTGDADTGIFEAAANTVGISAGGTKALEIGTTGVTVAGTLIAGGLTYPNVKGTKDQVLTSDGAGHVTWATVSAGSSYTLPAATTLALGGVKVADAAAITTGATGYVVDAAQLKAVNDAHVKKVGDHMTGALTITYNTAPPADGHLVLAGDGQGATESITTASASAGTGSTIRLNRSRGTLAAPAAVHASDRLATITVKAADAAGIMRGAGGLAVLCSRTPLAGETGVASEWQFTVGTSTAAQEVLRLTGGNIAGTSGLTATYVNATVATVSQQLNVKGPIAQTATYGVGYRIDLTPVSATDQATGINVTLVAGAAKTSEGVSVTNPGSATGTNVGVGVHTLPAGGSNYAFFTDAPAQSYFRGNVGINWTTPTHNLEVQGTAMVRGTLEVTGNLTSAGTAHSFAAKSIPIAAVNGAFPATGGNVTGVLAVNTATPATEAAAAKVVIVGDALSAANLAESNTKAAVSIRPMSASSYTLAVGATLPGNNPYLQVVTKGGTASGPLAIQPYGGSVTIGKAQSATHTLDIQGTLDVSGNISSAGTAHSFAANSIPASAINGLTVKTQVITQAAYDALATKDATTLYLISG